MTTLPRIVPNPELTVGEDNKQLWNQPAHRRWGFHNAHRLFRRAHMVRARNVFVLHPVPPDDELCHPAIDTLISHPAFSALVCVRGNEILFERYAEDFGEDRIHSIQSISKMHIHLIVGRLLAEGRINLKAQVGSYLPEIGTGYANARVQDILNMNLRNDFSEDYTDPNADCYTEEIALGWRLPEGDALEPTLAKFASGITGSNLDNPGADVLYKSANTDVLTLIAAQLCGRPLLKELELIADAAGYQGAFHISLSPELLPAFSGGGCVSARDLARFGLIFARGGKDIHGRRFANEAFLRASLVKPAPHMTPPRNWLKYANHLMTDGRLIGHAGYGGQFLMVDTRSGLSCAFFSVLENDAGYDEDYAAEIAEALRLLCVACASSKSASCISP